MSTRKRKSATATESVAPPPKKAKNGDEEEEQESSGAATPPTGVGVPAPEAGPGSELHHILRFDKGSTLSNFKEYEHEFDNIADVLLNHCTVFINQIPHSFAEVEFYYNGYNHQDKFTHGDEVQLTHAHWYFHRTGGKYRGGSFKGMDITFGGPTAYGGVLIRGLRMLVPPNTFIDGPCLCVDHILELNKADSIDSFVKSQGTIQATLRPEDDRLKRGLYVEYTSGMTEGREAIAPLKTPRFGLTLKVCSHVCSEFNFAKNFVSGKEYFFAKPYRYLAYPKLTKKGKNLMAVALHCQGKDTATIRSVTGATGPSIEKAVTSYVKGTGSTDFSKFIDQSLSTDDTCELCGACATLL